MSFEIQFFGATEQVTGSLYVVRANGHTVLLECGQVQGGRNEELQNREPFPIPVSDIDAVILSHAHIDHSGRVPLLFKCGYQGPVYAQLATVALCAIMLPDSGYLNEKDAEWQNKDRQQKGMDPLQPLYTKRDAEECMRLFRGVKYGAALEIVPGLTLRLHDAGHILGSAIVELECSDSDGKRRLVFSGDLGGRAAPVMDSPQKLRRADLVLMESTYGDRLHRPFADTLQELGDVIKSARADRGNILIPAFTVGRTQDLLYLMAEHFDAWQLKDWRIFLDSPMGIEANDTYYHYRHLYGAHLFGPDAHLLGLPNFHATRSTEESMSINPIRSGAIIIAGSGMCSGGRIHHHLKNNIARAECHVIFVGYQALGTLGRRIVDGADEIRLWGEKYAVRAQVHTIGGLSAHADQDDLIDWYSGFEDQPPLYLVHGEPFAQQALAAKIASRLGAVAAIARNAQTVEIKLAARRKRRWA
ncbi:MAG: MBL fold metallo-hydrolase [Gammaproteobacteria bacterium]|nr:MBL fold metallo-hydrolase [Gammaproteobacteria bacterium]MDH5303116.1 MBL fold metallo-hydrolase [Gammaproteobacteria bacterium]MDH5322162.1 MBL fold metallo-hydrolase [Gammaproteobacteria bacterium]